MFYSVYSFFVHLVLNLLFLCLDSERNWNMTLPGFGGDEIKTYRKPVKKFMMTGYCYPSYPKM